MTLTTGPRYADQLDYPLLHRGKVRELYAYDADRLLMVATDHISAFDHVLDSTDPGQGCGAHPAVAVVVRPARRHRRQPRAVHRRARAGPRSRGDLRAAGDDPGGVRGARLPDGLRLAGVPAVRVRSAASRCRPGLHDGSRLDEPIFTPATKAALGEHDENVSYEVVVDTVGAEVAERIRELTLAVYRPRGGASPATGGSCWPTPSSSSAGEPDGTIVLADEVLTPDSSRFWDAQCLAAGGAGLLRQAVRQELAAARLRLGPPQWRGPAGAPGRRSWPPPGSATCRRTSG